MSKPVYQPLPMSLAAGQPETFRQLAEAVFDRSKQLLKDAHPTATRDDHRAVLGQALELIEAEAGRERAEEMSRRIIEQQAAEQARRSRLTANDPEVQAEMEGLKRLDSASLNLLRDADLTPARRVAVDLLLKQRASEVLSQATTAASAQSTAA